MERTDAVVDGESRMEPREQVLSELVIEELAVNKELDDVPTQHFCSLIVQSC